MADQKGQWHLIRAFSVLHKEHPEARLLILGEGPLKEELRLLCKKLNIEDAVLMPGFVSNPFAYISKAKFYAFSSNHEGFYGCKTVHDFMRLTDEMVHTIIGLEEELVRWRQVLIKYLPPEWADKG